MSTTLQETPSANRIHIGLYGRRNAGKSSLLNMITGQQISIVSDIPGTTTDPVLKPMEVHGIGPCIFIDTAGYDDDGNLGIARIDKTRKTTYKTDIALLVIDADELSRNLYDSDYLTLEEQWISYLKENRIPVILVINKIDLVSGEQRSLLEKKMMQWFPDTDKIVFTSAREQEGFTSLRGALLRNLPESAFAADILRDLVKESDLVLLVMPQDIQAPKGRLILPQVQTIRELLDKKCCVMSCTTDQLENTLQYLAKEPRLIITDSQVFKQVYQMKPKKSLLTSFSILFAAHKGDLEYYVTSINKLDRLDENAKVLIAECCTHAPLPEDIGREKIPRLLKKRFGEKIDITVVSGTDYPEDLSGYDFIIQCGGCMFNRKYVLGRIERAKKQNIPMSNYGIVLAYFNQILDKVELPGIHIGDK